MFTSADMQALLNAQPFVPFRLYLSDGTTVDVRHRELAVAGRRSVWIGLPDPTAEETLFDRWMVAYYMHVTNVEALGPGAPPMTPPTGPSESPSPSIA